VVAPESVPLPLREDPVAGDPYSRHPGLSFGWNAYSGSGEVTEGVVYANYGRKEDFERLAALGVDVRGKIVLARYGGNFRGYKAKFAEAAGAAGLVVYTDPRDSGYFRGLMYPEGGWANPSYIQRGSILTLPWRGDPLTPFAPATRDAKRLDPEEVPLPRIPVQPVGWRAAKEILGRMKGPPVPEGWQGALPFTYRLTGGDGLRVRLKVVQEREVVRTVNVTGTLVGTKHPEQLVVVGSHHDAWGFGAGDPLSGTILVLESARCFAEAAKAGFRPARSLVFAAWAAEEYGIIGSVEWVEAHRERLSENCVAYINLDMAAMGPKFSASAAPALQLVIREACRGVVPEVPERFGMLGGGSDHVGFYCHMGVPAAGLRTGGAKGVSYHSTYDNLAWYRKVVGEDYAPAVMLTKVVNRVLARLSDDALLPLDSVAHASEARRQLGELSKRAREFGSRLRLEGLSIACFTLERRARSVQEKLGAALAKGELDGEKLERVNRALMGMDRAWLHGPGLPDRPWFRNLNAAPDESSGYAAWMLPGLRRAVENRDAEELDRMKRIYGDAIRRLRSRVDEIAEVLGE
jgi:N-acetylated-alpha-linked acidic dipeptidase